MFEPDEDLIIKRIKDFIKNKDPPGNVYIMLRNGRILNVYDYRTMVISDKINPRDAYVYIVIGLVPFKTVFYYPFLAWYEDLLLAYLSKLGFYYGNNVAPATGIKYMTFALRYGGYLTVEIVNLDTTVNNTNLRKIVVEVLDGKITSEEKELTKEEYYELRDTFDSQKLFVGHIFVKAGHIIFNYYGYGDKSLVKEVARIAMEYDRIFQPYRVCYDMKTWKKVDCWSIKLD